jgi:Polyketide cyclase / dehydrase and lipid transport
MREYEQTQTIDASADEAFAWLSDVSNLSKYLPPVIDASIEGPSAGDNPGRRVRATLEYPSEGWGTFDAEGYLAVDEGRRRMEWGAEVERDYSGWLEVADGADGESQVTVHLNFGERSAEPGIRERTPEGRDPLAEGISATLESIRRQIEEGTGKVEPPAPPPGAEPPTDQNPAVVDPPDASQS